MNGKIKDLEDQIIFWRRHTEHIMNGDRYVEKLIAWESFDPRKHCKLCSSDYESLLRFRKRVSNER